jgi:LEA14-like dessication related protein
MNIKKGALTLVGAYAAYEAYEYSKVYGAVSYSVKKFRFTKIAAGYIDVETVVQVVNDSSRGITLNALNMDFMYRNVAFAGMRKSVSTFIKPNGSTQITFRARLSNERTIAMLLHLVQNGERVVDIHYTMRCTAKLLLIPVPIWVKQKMRVDIGTYFSSLKQIAGHFKNVSKAWTGFLAALKKDKSNKYDDKGNL